MKNKKLLLITIPLALLNSCNGQSSINKDDIVFNNVVSEKFDGLGVEWGTYEDTNKLSSNSWERITGAVDKLNPRIVRCMFNLEWIVDSFDAKNPDDAADDVWTYNFDNKYAKNACDVLDYCQAHNIDVAFGIWNVIGDVDEEKDEWEMIPNATSDSRWPKLISDFMDYFVRIKGYSCIKWFVNTNEPNYTGAVGMSKNAYNTYEKWETGVKNVRKALDDLGLNYIDIIGGDTTGFAGSRLYLPNIANNLSDVVKNYGVHMYIGNYDIDTANYQKNMKALYDEVKAIDDTLGKSKNLLIWEAGLLDGKNVDTDCNSYIANYSYGMRMADYTVQSILAGVNGIVYWDLDDAMHFMYQASGSTAKEWGMFSSLATASSLKQEYRPWYHSSVLLTNLLEKDATIYSATNELEEGFRTLGVVSKDKKNGGFIGINRTIQPIKKTFIMDSKVEHDNKLYVYIFNEQYLRLGSDGFVVENFVIDGSINNKTEIEIPANSMVVVSTRRL